jgi:hypothetical protein
LAFVELQKHQLGPLALRFRVVHFFGAERFTIPSNASFDIGDLESNMAESQSINRHRNVLPLSSMFTSSIRLHPSSFAFILSYDLFHPSSFRLHPFKCPRSR